MSPFWLPCRRSQGFAAAVILAGWLVAVGTIFYYLSVDDWQAGTAWGEVAWLAADGTVLARGTMAAGISALAIAADGQMLAAGTREGEVGLFARDGSLVHKAAQLVGVPPVVTQLRFGREDEDPKQGGRASSKGQKGLGTWGVTALSTYMQ
jgi:hypothetical protein